MYRCPCPGEQYLGGKKIPEGGNVMNPEGQYHTVPYTHTLSTYPVILVSLVRSEYSAAHGYVSMRCRVEIPWSVVSRYPH